MPLETPTMMKKDDDFRIVTFSRKRNPGSALGPVRDFCYSLILKM